LQADLDIVILARDFECGSNDWAQGVVTTGVTHSTPLMERALDPVSILGEAEPDDMLHAVIGEADLFGVERIRPRTGIHLCQCRPAFQFGKTNPFSPTEYGARSHAYSSGRGRPTTLLETLA
tara:strand:- start:321 stop:686 length:366 start_codon:yes stop_codon:yes gene_type:complete